MIENNEMFTAYIYWAEQSFKMNKIVITTIVINMNNFHQNEQVNFKHITTKDNSNLSNDTLTEK
jgi:hypothetical protein